MAKAKWILGVCTAIVAVGHGGCANDDETASSATPTMSLLEGASSIEAWLAQGSYKRWHCEPAIHLARAPSPHGYNRICSNDVIAAHARDDQPFPRGAAAVKELYDRPDATSPIGYAVYYKTASESDGGANWYWYERVPLNHAAPHDEAGVVADGLGNAGPARSICVGCHAAAGSDMAHTPSPGGRDQVYTPVE